MEELVLSFIPKLEFLAQILGGIVIVATVVAKLTPTPKDDSIVDKVAKIVLKVVKYLPTLGVNPNTKSLEKAYDELKKEEEKK